MRSYHLAVPFFFMTGGYFTVVRYAKDASGLWRFEKRAALWYLAATLLYLPVDLRNGCFSSPGWLAELVRDVVFDGTFYHLWYLPAAMLGCAIAYALVRRWDYPAALAVTGALYLTGLFGDTLVGLDHVPPYRELLLLMDRTRNGLFFAPLFFVLGALCRDARVRPKRVWLGVGFLLSLALQAGETLALRELWWGKHYAMTLTLPVTSVFLLSLLASFRGRRRRGLRTFSLLFYLLHPMCILLIRAFARAAGLWELLVERSGPHFFAVVLLTAAVSVLLTLLLLRLTPAAPDRERGRAWIELDLSALRHNVLELSSLMPPGSRLMAVVKRDAYGHGAFEIATALERCGVSAFAAATLDEAIALRRYGLRGTVLVLGHTDPARVREARRYRVTLTVADLPHARALSAQGAPVQAHLKLDTGMHRLGVPWDDVDAIREIAALPNLTLTGVFTHLACSESRDERSADFTELQTRRFQSVLDRLEQCGLRLDAHLDSTYGLLNYPGFEAAYVRVGLGLYGVYSKPGDLAAQAAGLRPVLSLKARVASLRCVPAGEGAGYDLHGASDRPRTLAILPIGYGDGYPRALSDGVGYVLLHGRPAPVAGLVCMDMTAVDVTDIPGVKVGDVATLIGRDGGAQLSAETLAALAGTITNELLSRLGPRLKRTIKQE